MRVFITGGAGFIGSEFARSALNGNLKEFNIEPTELIVYDSLTYAGNMQNLDILQNNNNFKFIHGNICDPNLNKYIPYECDLITNGSWDDTFPLSPNSPYAASKASADLITLSYYKTYKLPLMITRCSNNYGPYQNIEKLIPLFITNLIEGKKVPLYGNGKNIREWIHVLDHVRGIAFAYKYGGDGEIYNIAGDTELTNIDITQIILQNFNFDNSKIEYVADRRGHDFRYSLNDKKIKSLGFKNKIKFEEGLKETISWYQNNQDWYRL